MNFDEAKQQIRNILDNVPHDDLECILHWTKNVANDMLDEQFGQSNQDIMLDHIREDIRESLPLEAISSTESIVKPEVGSNADCDPGCTISVDGFLYDDDIIDDLCDEGKMSRNYCTACGSRAVQPLTFVTHSSSVPQVKFIFQYLLKDLRGKKVLDVGSRTGALLYGAYLYSEAESILGVEMDTSFCELQQRIVDKNKMGERITVVHSDILEQAELLRSSDVIILNNVFEFFMPLAFQLKLWTYLSNTIRKKNTILITVPSLEESLSDIQATIDVKQWVKPIDTCCEKKAASTKLFANKEDSDLGDICMYRVR